LSSQLFYHDFHQMGIYNSIARSLLRGYDQSCGAATPCVSGMPSEKLHSGFESRTDLLSQSMVGIASQKCKTTGEARYSFNDLGNHQKRVHRIALQSPTLFEVTAARCLLALPREGYRISCFTAEASLPP
jgi:hypothetical protein